MTSTNKTFHVGCVSYLNAKPLIYGLDRQPDISLGLEVPSLLIRGLREERYDVALLPVIDYQRLANLQIVPSGGIGCNGPTLTVRIFSRTPIHQIRVLACDTDSHTSVALARILLGEIYRIRPEMVDLKSDHRTADSAVLLIGDKVVCEEPVGMEHQLDLGSAWHELTGLPFVFAVWVARGGIDLTDLPARLTGAREAGMRHIDEIVEQYAVPRGWPAPLARKYLTEYLKFEIGPAQIHAVELFHSLAAKYNLLDGDVAPLRIYGSR